MHLSVMQCLFSANNLFFPYFAQIIPILDGVGDNEPLVKIFVVDKKCETGLMPQSAALQRVALYGAGSSKTTPESIEFSASGVF